MHCFAAEQRGPASQPPARTYCQFTATSLFARVTEYVMQSTFERGRFFIGPVSENDLYDPGTMG